MDANTIWQARPALGKLLNSGSLDENVAYRLKPLARAVSDLEQSVEKLIRSFPVVETNGALSVTSEAIPAYREKFAALMDEQIHLETMPAVTIEEVRGVGLSVMDLVALDWLVGPAGKNGRAEP